MTFPLFFLRHFNICNFADDMTPSVCDETIESSHPEEFLGKGVLKICSKFTGDQLYGSEILIKLLTLRHECSPVNLLHIFRTPLLKSTS